MIQEPLTISRAEKADCDEIYTLYHSLIDDPYGTWNDEYPSKECVENDLAENIVYVMRDATGRIVSSIVDEQDITNLTTLRRGTRTTRWAQLGRLGVAHGAGHGIARKMLAHAMDQAKERCQAVRFLVATCNIPAQRSYAKLNYGYAASARVGGRLALRSG
ncbi:MAG: GNAT family N-acetyltransferase [Christensenellales bacterium]